MKIQNKTLTTVFIPNVGNVKPGEIITVSEKEGNLLLNASLVEVKENKPITKKKK